MTLPPSGDMDELEKISEIEKIENNENKVVSAVILIFEAGVKNEII